MNCGKNELSTRLERSRVLTVTGVSTGKRANLADWGEFDFRSPRRQSDAERATIGLPFGVNFWAVSARTCKPVPKSEASFVSRLS